MKKRWDLTNADEGKHTDSPFLETSKTRYLLEDENRDNMHLADNKTSITYQCDKKRRR